MLCASLLISLYYLQFEKQDPNQLYDDWIKNVDANQQTENSILAKLTKPNIKAAEFSKTFLAYAKEQQHQFANGEASEEVDVVMTENGNVGGNTLANPAESPKSVVEVRTIIVVCEQRGDFARLGLT